MSDITPTGDPIRLQKIIAEQAQQIAALAAHNAQLLEQQRMDADELGRLCRLRDRLRQAVVDNDGEYCCWDDQIVKMLERKGDFDDQLSRLRKILEPLPSQATPADVLDVAATVCEHDARLVDKIAGYYDAMTDVDSNGRASMNAFECLDELGKRAELLLGETNQRSYWQDRFMWLHAGVMSLANQAREYKANGKER